MKVLKKGERVEDCKRAVRMAKDAGFKVGATFIYGIPGETHEDRMDCIRLTRELKLDMVRYNNATPYPGTELFQITKREGRLNIKGQYENFNSVGGFVENPFRRNPFSYVPQNCSEKDIRMDILLGYLRFYFSIKKMLKILTRGDELGWFNAGRSLREKIKKIPPLLFLSSMMLIKFSHLFCYMAAYKIKKVFKIRSNVQNNGGKK